jgi:Virulence factor membrane-bound polymerase, C-terminal/Protein glycosylation ligase
MTTNLGERRPLSLVTVCLGFLLVAAWLNPTRYLPWTSFYGELPAAVGGIVFAGALIWALRRSPIRLSPSAVVLLALIAVVLAQRLGGLILFSGDALIAVAYLVGGSVCLTLGASMPLNDRSHPITKTLAWAFLLGAIASTAIALQQWFGQADWSEWVVRGVPGSRVDANIGQANHLASLVLCGILAATYLRVLGMVTSPALVVIVGFLAIGLALSQSRTPWLAAAVIAAWMLVRRSALWTPLNLRARTLVPLMAWYALVFWAAIALPGPLLLDEGTGPSTRLEAGARPLLWSQMLEAIRLSPWVSYGWLQGQTAQAAAALTKPGLEYSSYAHNLVLDLMVWNGVPLGLLLSGLLAWWYFRRGLKATGAADSFRFGVLTVFAVHSMLEYPFAYAYFLVPVALLAGQLEASDAPPAISAQRATLYRVGFIGCAVACTALVVAIARDYVLAEADRREVQMVMLRIGGVRPFPPVPDFWVLDQLEAATRNARVTVRPGMPAAELDDLLTVTRRYPGAYFLRMSAAALALHGREAEGLDQLRRLRGLHGERQFQAALTALNEMSPDKGWPLAGWLATAARLP